MAGEEAVDYSEWSRQDLIERIRTLEQAPHVSRPISPPHNGSVASLTKRVREFDWSKYTTRNIALKFAYFGWDYNGLAVQKGPTPLPTIEEKLFEALVRAKLIQSPETCNFSRCGRTDRGVSSLGQVVSLRVRSALDPEYIQEVEDKLSEIWQQTSKKRKKRNSIEVDLVTSPEIADEQLKQFELPKNISPPELAPPPGPELPYVSILNRLLPPDIRVLAWASIPPEFDARFDCVSRRYKYYFLRTNLDIERMQDAANRLLGLHDFRNFCKIDASKQLTHWDRYIMCADIQRVTNFGADGVVERSAMWSEVEANEMDLFVLNVHGSAFLWHQIRCIMQILFLIGRRLEDPSIVDRLLDTKNEMPNKPVYEIAQDVPLVLVDCEFDPRVVEWDGRYNETDETSERGYPLDSDVEAMTYTYQRVWTQYADAKCRLSIMEHFADHLAKTRVSDKTNRLLGDFSNAASHGLLKEAFYNQPTLYKVDRKRQSGAQNAWVHFGGGKEEFVKNYIPLDKRGRLDPPEVQNEKYKLKMAERGQSLYEPKYARGEQEETTSLET